MSPVWLTAAVALVWMLPFVLGGRAHARTSRAQRAWVSAAGGAAIAYVFVDLLPEMQRMQEAFTEAAAGRGFPFPHYRVYTAALAGFVLFYALEHTVAATRPGEPAGHQARPLVYAVHVGGFAVYGGLMAYVLRMDAERSVQAIVLYGIAMLCHFLMVDHSLREEHGTRYATSGHWIPCIGIAAGWAMAAAGLSSDLIIPTLMGFIAGGVVLNSVKDELPSDGQGQPLPFITGASAYAVLLLLVG